MIGKIAGIIFVIITVFFIGCGVKNNPEIVEITQEPQNIQVVEEEKPRTPEDMRSQMKLLFPETIAGWKKVREIGLFDEKTLFEHINGAAEAYFAYDFKLCGTAEYNPGDEAEKTEFSATDRFILIDIYDMGSPINAFGMYTSEISGDESVDIGVEGYIEYSALNFWKGPYYVKITASSTDDDMLQANVKLAEYIADKIPGNTERPAMLALLPKENLVSGTERFILKNILGYSFLKNGLMASYKVGGENKSVIIAEHSSIDEAKDTLRQFVVFEEKSGSDLIKDNTLGEEGFTVNDKYYKRLIVSRNGKYIIVIMGVTDEPAARVLLREIVTNISKLK